MQKTLVEKLSNGYALFNIPYERKILPGQWLSGNNIQFPVFRSSQENTQFIAPENIVIPDKLTISGVPLSLPDDESSLILLAENQAVFMVFHLINHLQQLWGDKYLRNRINQILLGSDTNFPFRPVPSRFIIEGFPLGAIASAQLLEDLALPARLASEADLAGCYSGSLSQLVEQIDFNGLQQQTCIVAMGSKQLLESTKKLFAGESNKQFLVNFE